MPTSEQQLDTFLAGTPPTPQRQQQQQDVEQQDPEQQQQQRRRKLRAVAKGEAVLVLQVS